MTAVVETTAYLLVDEALANADQHAHATECTLAPPTAATGSMVEVRDNGIGGAEPRPGGGLECLADRAAAIGGRSRSTRRAAAAPRSGRDPDRLSDDWRYSFRDRIRYGDLDTNAHLNNVAVHQFFESARVAYMRGLFPDIDPIGRAGGLGMIFAETHVASPRRGSTRRTCASTCGRRSCAARA